MPAPQPNQTHRLYFVVPRDIRRFSFLWRRQLNVQGGKLDGLPANPDLQDVPGYLAWLKPEQAAHVDHQSDVALVHEIGPDDVTIDGLPTMGRKTLQVSLAPNDWTIRPDAETYSSAKALAEQWSTQFARFRGLRFRARLSQRGIYIEFGTGPVPTPVLDAIKAHPQVYQMTWPGEATTRALGEEGGEVTTYALGEEGGYPPTSYRLGEEGTYPPTTTRCGEEGTYPPTSYRLGEEGGTPPTTMRLGEEGGTPPTTHRFGEEGGTLPTTRAIGEEGGTPPTTQAVGEEGGNPFGASGFSFGRRG